jgi:ubiquitin-protein ligase
MQSCFKRLQKEKSQLALNIDETIKLTNLDSSITDWTAVIVGPVGSYYENYEFDLVIRVPNEYPLVPPIIKFKTKIFHPNVLFEVSLSVST